MRKHITIISLILAFTLLLCSCGKSSSNRKVTVKDIVGSWKWEDDKSTTYFTFNDDGTGHTSGGSKVKEGFYASGITFTIEDEKLVTNDGRWERTYKAVMSGDKLVLTDQDGNAKEFERYEET